MLPGGGRGKRSGRHPAGKRHLGRGAAARWRCTASRYCRVIKPWPEGSTPGC